VVPNHPLALGILWEANYYQGNYEESFRYCGKLFNLGEENTELILDTYEKQGNIAAVEKVITMLEAIPDEQIPVSAAIRIAVLYHFVDRTDAALDILETILEEQGPDLPYATTGGRSFEKLKNDPRFLAIIEKMGLPPPATH
jgi:tetratricopeptide (TPR) repeat protein